MAMSDVVFTEEISGYLLKWTNIIKGYQKRWFLVKNGLLSYYRNPESVGRRCRGTFDLSHAILSAPDNQTSFIITEITGRRHHLKAMSDEDKTRWINILTSVIEKSHSSADVESDTFSEDSHFPPNIGSRCSRGSSGRQRRLFRNRPRSDQRLSFRHSSSPNLPQGNGLAFENASGTASPPSSQSPKISAETTPRLLYNPRTLFDPARFNFDSVAFPYSESSTVVRKTDSGISHTLSQIRRSSASTELTAILELVSSVETFRQRLNEHTSLVCTQLLAMENLLSTPEINLILADLARSHPNSDDLKTLGITDAKQLASRLLFMVKENRSSVKDFHATYSEALQFLVNNFSRWHQRVQAEQERCVGLERTVEQLARQHRALEIQLSQCYSYPTEELSMDGIVIRCPRGSTLARDFRTSRTSTLNREFQSPEHSDEDDQFFDAQSAMSGEPVPSCSELPDTKMFNKLLILPRAEGVRASATSLHSLVDADESSSASDSAIEEEAELSRPFQEHSPRESAIQSRRVSSVDTPVSTVSQDRFFSSGRQRRTFIRPSPKVALNLWSIIKNGIGKDLTKIPIPVNFNEPISFLQRAAEDLAYSYLLDQASQVTDPAEQMALIAAFSVSCYATTAIRTGKPFNPLLGETFELDRTDDSYGWRLIAEQVSHHPPGSAMYCESPRFGWQLWVEFVLVSKFRGKYMSVIPKGTVNLRLSDGSRYTWSKATTVVHNLIVGSLWIDNYGDVLIQNHTKGYTCPMRFIAHSYFNRGPPKQVTGVVQNGVGNPVRLVRGMWDSYIETQDVNSDGTPSGDPRTLWTALPLEPAAEKMYNFSQFTIQLNELEPDVAPTDSRLRPDQRLMEDGYWDQANEEKRRLEQKQRTKRHRWEEEQASGSGSKMPLFTPVWFVSRKDPVTGEESHVYKGNYWDAKKAQDWSACPDIY